MVVYKGVATLKQQEVEVVEMLKKKQHSVPTITALAELPKAQVNLNFDPYSDVLGFNFTFCFHCFDSEIFDYSPIKSLFLHHCCCFLMHQLHVLPTAMNCSYNFDEVD